MTARPTLSVALVTRNRPEYLARCLESIRNQSVQPYELLVADDSDDVQRPTVCSVATKYSAVYLEGPRRGLYANRNFAAARASGSHVRTVDDDHLLPQGHLDQCLAAITSDQSAIWTTGEIGVLDGIKIYHCETANQLHPSGAGTAPLNLDDNWCIADGSTCYPSEVFRKGYRMVEAYGFGSSYLEFGAYLYSKGWKSRCVRGAVVEHYTSPETLGRSGSYERMQCESVLFASLAYNLHFRKNIPCAVSYILKAIIRSKLDPAFVPGIPAIIKAVNKRWDS